MTLADVNCSGQAEENPDYADTEGRKPNDNQGGKIISDCCLAAEILKYNKATILNNCVQTHVQGWYQKASSSLERGFVGLDLSLFRITDGGNRFKSTSDTQKATRNGDHGPKEHNGRDVAPHRRMHGFVSEPKNGVNAMDEITEKQPGDDGRGRDAAIMDWCWKNQDEEKC